jgi:23S rRNA pseudouridine1911/1915/1917 synthase
MSVPRTVFPVGPGDRGKRLDRFLHERIPRLSRSRIQQVIRERVSLSWGARPRPARPVMPGGEVVIGFTSLVEQRRDVEIPVLARGAGWLAVDKPAGIPVHPVNAVRENSLIRMLRRQEGREGLRLVHRLDRETTGVLLVAEDPPTARFLATAFEERRVRKEYLALVSGVVAGSHGRIDLPIVEATRSKVFVRREAGAGAGQPSVTEWEVVRRLPDRTLLRLCPRTGRRHQIRVHLMAIGHPVLGDPLYGRPDRDYLDLIAGRRDARRERGGPLRQLLHCARLVFPDPCGAGTIDVGAPLPADFEV